MRLPRGMPARCGCKTAARGGRERHPAPQGRGAASGRVGNDHPPRPRVIRRVAGLSRRPCGGCGVPHGGKYTVEQELDHHAQYKLLACRRAVESIRDGDTLFVDCGSTMQLLAECLPSGLSLSVICFSMNVAGIVTRRPDIQVMLLGGLYHASSQSFSSDEALGYLRRLESTRPSSPPAGCIRRAARAVPTSARWQSNKPRSPAPWRASWWSTRASSAA